MIRNYLGFPRGISGGDLVFRAWEQALLFGAEFVFTHLAIGLTSRDGLIAITLSGGDDVLGRAVILASGVEYRRLGVPSLDRWTGAGLFYGAAGAAGSALAGERVCVVGGANSAGQAALHLSQFASHVTLIVRGAALEAGMSDYLVRQIQVAPNVEVRLRSRIVEGHGGGRLAALELEHAEGRRETIPSTAVFVMIGAEGARTGLASRSVATIMASCSRVATSRQTRGRPTSHPCPSKPACPACSRWVTCATVPSSASPKRWARARSRLDPCISTSHEVSRAPTAAEGIPPIRAVVAREVDLLRIANFDKRSDSGRKLLETARCCVALNALPRETFTNLSITGHLRGFSDQPGSEIVQCGEPPHKLTQVATRQALASSKRESISSPTPVDSHCITSVAQAVWTAFDTTSPI
jgi:thioredoxin reductase